MKASFRQTLLAGLGLAAVFARGAVQAEDRPPRPDIVEVDSATAFDSAVTGTKKMVLIDFYATWCKPCRAFGPVLEEYAREHPATVRLVRIDSDKNSDLSSEFRIRNLPTLIAAKNDQTLLRTVGAMDEQELRTFVKQAESAAARAEKHARNAPSKSK
jgi:thioredoxin